MSGRSQPPTARLRRLAAELLRLRKAAGLSREAVAEETSINKATLYRIETAKARPQLRTLKALLDLYEVEEAEREELVVLLREANQQGWLKTFEGELPDRYSTFIGFESEARQLLTYEALLIPGLLQTEDYARAVIRGMLPLATDDEVETRVTARIERQQILEGDQLRFWVVIDEAALRRNVGDAAVLRAQLEHLRQAARRPNVTLQLLPFDAGPHPALLGAFVILKFGEIGAPDMVYIESEAGDLFLDDEISVERYNTTFEHLRATALSSRASADFLSRHVREVK
jgi:transcriptional regulator with XRE-family HTH domain